MNQNLFKAIIAAELSALLLVRLPRKQKPKSGVNAWHVPK